MTQDQAGPSPSECPSKTWRAPVLIFTARENNRSPSGPVQIHLFVSPPHVARGRGRPAPPPALPARACMRRGAQGAVPPRPLSCSGAVLHGGWGGAEVTLASRAPPSAKDLAPLPPVPVAGAFLASPAPPSPGGPPLPREPAPAGARATCPAALLARAAAGQRRPPGPPFAALAAGRLQPAPPPRAPGSALPCAASGRRSPPPCGARVGPASHPAAWGRGNLSSLSGSGSDLNALPLNLSSSPSSPRCFERCQSALRQAPVGK